MNVATMADELRASKEEVSRLEKALEGQAASTAETVAEMECSNQSMQERLKESNE